MEDDIATHALERGGRRKFRDSREEQIFRGNARLTTVAQRGKWSRLFTDPAFASRAIRYALRLPVRQQTEDRRILEQLIFPRLAARADIRSILFVGCAWYTKHYERKHFPRKDYWTLDAEPGARKFGGRRHIVDRLEHLQRYFPANFFDLIICNGVLGFGLDSVRDCDQAFDACYRSLRKGGQLLLGWNDMRERAPVALAEVRALRHF